MRAKPTLVGLNRLRPFSACHRGIPPNIPLSLTLSKVSNVIVVLFVHGWHHNAKPGDENLRDFAASVTDTRRRLIDIANPESEVYRLSRKNLTGTESLSVISIYVGWRGRSLPWILDYITFWGRKASAERVGQGDLREFLIRLNSLYREKRDLRANGTTRHFLGMTSFGHSFGGQVLFKAVAGEIENELIAKVASPNGSSQGAKPVIRVEQICTFAHDHQSVSINHEA